MARTRFVGDAGLTARMTLVMFLLGGLFVVLIVGLMLAVQSFVLSLLIYLLPWLLLAAVPVLLIRRFGKRRPATVEG